MIPKLFVLVGICSSGKSFIASKLEKENNAVIISSDSIREELYGDCKNQEHNDEVFRIFHKRIKDNLLNNKNVVADATNLTIKSRKVFFENLSKINCYIIAHIVSRNIEECVKSNSTRYNSVPDHVIYRQQRQFQIPFIHEGFNEIIVYDNNQENHSEDFKTSLRLMSSFDQKTKWHTLLLQEHCDILADNYIIDWLRICGKLHDIGKLFTQSVGEDENCHYYGHAESGTYYLLSNWKDLKEFNLSDEDLLKLLFVVNYHMLPFDWNSEKSNEKWKNIFGEEVYDTLIEFNTFDRLAK